MKRVIILLSLSAAMASTIISSCVHKPSNREILADGNYPTEIAKILVAKCAVSGCHNAASYMNADNILLDTWEHLFQGSNSGAIVVPYNVQNSPLLYFVNTDSSLGLVATPRMPANSSSTPAAPLSTQEYTTLKNWIANGAPDKNGNIAFAADAANRQKVYITQQLCDLMAVIDCQSHLIMRYIQLGTKPSQIETPHCTRMNNDGSNAYVSFMNGDYLQKIDTRTDLVTGNANVGGLRINGSWNILYVAPADTAVVTSSFTDDGIVAHISAADMNVIKSLGGGSSLVYPHGITSNQSFDTLFVTAQYGNVVYRISRSTNPIKIKAISLDSNPPVTSSSTTYISLNPHEILMSPDYSRYFVTCQGSNEVRIMDAHKDTLIAAISVGISPVEMAISSSKPYVFVTCQEDNSSRPGMKGSVYAINYNTLQATRIDGDFYQPHGIAVDDRNGIIYVASTNANPDGPAPHHPTAFAGRAGWYSLLNLNTLQAYDNRRYQLLVSPYSAATRFKQ